jgi:hypothetical protein
LLRFCGREVHAITDVEVYVPSPEPDEPRLLNLTFEARQALSIEVPEEERGPPGGPTVEVWIPVPSLEMRSLVGTTVEMPRAIMDEDDDGKWNRLYVFEHEDLWNVKVTFCEVTEETCRVQIEGEACDPNHYDGSKPTTQVSIDASFPLSELVDD